MKKRVRQEDSGDLGMVQCDCDRAAGTIGPTERTVEALRTQSAARM